MHAVRLRFTAHFCTRVLLYWNIYLSFFFNFILEYLLGASSFFLPIRKLWYDVPRGSHRSAMTRSVKKEPTTKIMRCKTFISVRLKFCGVDIVYFVGNEGCFLFLYCFCPSDRFQVSSFKLKVVHSWVPIPCCPNTK